jgi:quercetin dioxygenase-like cupin family protein
MQNRRTFFGLAAASLLSNRLGAQTSEPRPPTGKELARHSLTGPLEGYEVTLNEGTFYGASSPEHTHPSFVLGYVLEGQLRFAVNHEPERIVPAGGTFFEPLGGLHTTHGSATPNGGVRFLTFRVVSKGAR